MERTGIRNWNFVHCAGGDLVYGVELDNGNNGLLYIGRAKEDGNERRIKLKASGDRLHGGGVFRDGQVTLPFNLRKDAIRRDIQNLARSVARLTRKEALFGGNHSLKALYYAFCLAHGTDLRGVWRLVTALEQGGASYRHHATRVRGLLDELDTVTDAQRQRYRMQAERAGRQFVTPRAQPHEQGEKAACVRNDGETWSPGRV